MHELAPDAVGHAAGQELERDHPDRIDIASMVDRLGVAGGLLGAHVGDRAHQLTLVSVESDGLQIGFGGPRDAEVEDLRLRK